MMGDDKAKATVDAMMGGLLSGMSKYSLEKGISTSVLAKKKDLIRQVSLPPFFPVAIGLPEQNNQYVRGSCDISREGHAFDVWCGFSSSPPA